jgi:hypothetical protein
MTRCGISADLPETYSKSESIGITLTYLITTDNKQKNQKKLANIPSFFFATLAFDKFKRFFTKFIARQKTSGINDGIPIISNFYTLKEDGIFTEYALNQRSAPTSEITPKTGEAYRLKFGLVGFLITTFLMPGAG